MWESLRQRFQTWKPYLACGLPLVAGLLAFVYLSFSFMTADWKVNPPPTPAPTPAAQASGAAPCPTPHATAAEFGYLLCAPDALAEKFADSLKAGDKNNYTAADWKSAVSAAGLIGWRFTTGLVAVALLCAFVLSFLIIWHAPSRATFLRRTAYALGWLFACAVFFAATGGLNAERLAVVAYQYLGFIESQLLNSDIWDAEVALLRVGYILVTYMLCASGATLLPQGRDFDTSPPSAEAKSETRDLAARMRSLRLLLYAGAFMLAVGALRGKLNQEWALAYLPPLEAFEGAAQEKLAATLIYERLRTVGSNMITSVAFLNTLLLAAIYVPAAVVLQRRADALYDESAPAPASPPDEEGTDVESRPSREAWMQARGLSFPLKDQLGRVAVILSPLLAGPLGDLLSFLKD